MTPYTPGTRVVCQHPTDGWRVMTVLDVADELSVSDGERWGLVPASEVRPAMPRDRADLERWGRWWYLDNEVVSVRIGYPGLNVKSPSGWYDGPVNSTYPWRGPVAPPPEVRS